MSPQAFWSGGSLHPYNSSGEDAEEAEGEAAEKEGSAVRKGDSQAESTHQPTSAPAELNHLRPFVLSSYRSFTTPISVT